MSLELQIGLVFAGAVLCGLLVGALGGAPAGRGRSRLWMVNWLLLTLALLAVGFGLPAAGWVTGRPALWLEGAALLWAVYLIGCVAGCAVRRAPAGP